LSTFHGWLLDPRITAMSFHELRDRLANFDILEADEREGAKVFQAFRMGLGLSFFYPIPYPR
jgi:hypothetical protein